MCEPSGAGAAFASVGSAFKFADLAVRIAEVGSEDEVFVRTIHVVRDDLNEVERLLESDTMQRKLASIPGKVPWVRSAIDNTKLAFNEIGKWVERARTAQEPTGSIQLNTRVRWMFNDHEKIWNRTAELLTCHQQLSNVLSYLIRLEDIPNHVGPSAYQDTAHFNEMISRHKRKSIPKIWKSSDAIRADQNIAARGSLMSLSSSEFETPTSPSSRALRLHSPPPTYASALQANTELDNERNSFTTHLEQPIRPSMHKVDVSNSFTVNQESGDTWAYRRVPNDLPVSELAGDTVLYLSGTNSYGPVNPYEYSAPPQLSTLNTLSETIETNDVAELLGDLNFAVELPSNGPPPPGYPRQASRSTTYQSRYNNVAHGTRSQEQRRSVSVLPTTPKRKPILSHSFSEDGTMNNELLPAPVGPSISPPLSQRNVLTGQDRQVFTASELQLSLEQPSESHRSRSTEYLQSCSESSRPRSAASTSTGPDNLNVNKQAIAQGSSRLSCPNSSSMSPKPPEPAGSASMTRMRRQKQIMDLLESLG